MPVTQDDIDGLTRAIASGERQVTINGQTVTYRSISDLLSARDTLQREFSEQQVAAGEAAARPRAYLLTQRSRGYHDDC